MRNTSRNLIVFLTLIILLFPTVTGFAQAPIVRAVLFYSPTCPHCHEQSNFTASLANALGFHC
jgi:protein-disulfide isomerase